MMVWLFILGLALIVLQLFLPKVPWLEVRPFLLTLPVIYAGLRLDAVKALSLAIGLGLTLDVFSSQQPGFSSISLAVMVVFLLSQSENFKFDYLPHALLLTLLSTFLFLLVDYLFFCVQVETWRWPFWVWLQMGCQSMLVLVVAFPLYWLCDKVLPQKEPDQERGLTL